MNRSRAVSAFATLVILLLLSTVFLLYTRPDFLRDLADQLWACF